VAGADAASRRADRLLDFTWSPYVAAFFALQLATGDAAVVGV